MKYEYKTLTGSVELMAQALDKWGENGWKIVGVVQSPDAMFAITVILMREKP